MRLSRVLQMILSSSLEAHSLSVPVWRDLVSSISRSKNLSQSEHTTWPARAPDDRCRHSVNIHQKYRRAGDHDAGRVSIRPEIRRIAIEVSDADGVCSSPRRIDDPDARRTELLDLYGEELENHYFGYGSFVWLRGPDHAETCKFCALSRNEPTTGLSFRSISIRTLGVCQRLRNSTQGVRSLVPRQPRRDDRLEFLTADLAHSLSPLRNTKAVRITP